MCVRTFKTLHSTKILYDHDNRTLHAVGQPLFSNVQTDIFRPGRFSGRKSILKILRGRLRGWEPLGKVVTGKSCIDQSSYFIFNGKILFTNTLLFSFRGIA